MTVTAAVQRVALGVAAVSVVLSASAAWGQSQDPGPFGGQGSHPAPPSPGPVASIAYTVTDPGSPGGGTTGGPGAPGAPAAPSPYEYRLVPAIGPCGYTASGAVSQYVQRERRLRSGGVWEPVGAPYCTQDPSAPPPPVIDLADLAATAATVVAQVRAPAPALLVQPQGGSLVNQPALFRVSDPGAPPSGSALNPLSQRTVTVSLGTPTYHWDFGDTTGRDVGSARGTAYAGGSTVPREGDGRPYVSHTYGRPGTVTVTVTATYAVTWSFSGDPRTFTLPPLSVSDSAPLQVQAARSELVAP